MSIINKMLQDLDQRNGRSGGEVMAGDAVRSVKPASSWHLGRNTLLVIVGLILAALAGTWWLQQRSRQPESARVAVPAPAVAAKNAPPAGSQAAPVASVPEVVAAGAADPAEQRARAPAPTPDPHVVKVNAMVAASPARVAPPAPTPTIALATLSVGAPPSASIPPDKVEPQTLPPKAVAARPTGGKTYSAKQVSANLLGEAVMLDQQGRQEEAKAPLQRLLSANPLDVQARQMLVQLQLDTGQLEEASALLAEGRRLLPEQSGFSLTLARLKMESGDVGGAIQILETGLGSARNEPQYHAFLGAVLLRVKRYDEAVQHYLIALRSDPANPSWLVGAGVAFEGVGKPADAAEAYRRAEGVANLTSEVAAFVSERLARLGR